MANNGKQGEALFQQIMLGRNYEVQDVSNDSNYWYKDIDFIITSPTTNLTKTFEVKWDSRIADTGNLYLEIQSKNSKGGKGWFEFCEADYLAYGDSRKRKFYIMPMEALKQYVKKAPKRYAQCGLDSVGYVVSLKELADIIQEL